MRFGEYLKNLREELDISQRELAEKAGVSAAEISRIETGSRKKVSPDVIKAISPYLDVSYESLLSSAGYLDVNKVNYESIIDMEEKKSRNIEDHTDNVLAILASYLFLNKWSVERTDNIYPQTNNAQFTIFTNETPPQDISDVVAKKENEEWHIAVKDYQVDQIHPSRKLQEVTEMIYSLIFMAYGMIATYDFSPITKFSIATSRMDFFKTLKSLPPIHLNVKVSILLIDLEKNKVIEEHVFE